MFKFMYIISTGLLFLLFGYQKVFSPLLFPVFPSEFKMFYCWKHPPKHNGWYIYKNITSSFCVMLTTQS